ncbi:NK-lysin tandem duplicate 4 isoform X1 [Cyclopterus lumpus]|uniref:NK-lysin tandem duplicate 4 n=1 Tax=Cyclopterus lumpus TaxID=8103 RepID=A0A8C2XP92_CYCLU|nr:NK-lysin tandem duplicate 4 isoform X1 [Cyclopterus lumpus]
METSSLLLVCILVTCSVWTVHGRSFEINIDDGKQAEVELSVNAIKLPGLCWACKWALNKVKKSIGPNATAENLTLKFMSICKQIGLLKPLCIKFVKTHLAELVEEFTTTDDVKTICVNTAACKPKLLDPFFYPRDEELPIEMNEDI